jgi:hypothetical protein
MLLLVYYVVLVLIGTALAAIIGVWLDSVSHVVSLTAFFILFFGVLAGAWLLAVWLTAPKAGAQPAE